jgi:hypothetical protein
MNLARLTVLLLGFGVATQAGGVAAASPAGDPIRPESRLWIAGASDIRRFTCTAHQVSGSLDLRGLPNAQGVLTGENMATAPSVSVRVDKLNCGIGIMNRHLHEALRGNQHPSIDFRLVGYEVDLNPASPVAHITGVVTIAGARQPVMTTAAIRADSLGMLHVQGEYLVRPTDFGVAPPRRFGGLLRVRDRIAVHFDISLEPDGGPITAIECGLIQSVKLSLTGKFTHASRS